MKRSAISPAVHLSLLDCGFDTLARQRPPRPRQQHGLLWLVRHCGEAWAYRRRFASPLAFPQEVEVGLSIAKLVVTSVSYHLGIFAIGCEDPSAEGHACLCRTHRSQTCCDNACMARYSGRADVTTIFQAEPAIVDGAPDALDSRVIRPADAKNRCWILIESSWRADFARSRGSPPTRS